MPISDVIIAKRIEPNAWNLYESYKLGEKYSTFVLRLGKIYENNNTQLCIRNEANELSVEGNFSASRRHNLQGVIVICGLVVNKLFARVFDDVSNK